MANGHASAQRMLADDRDRALACRQQGRLDARASQHVARPVEREALAEATEIERDRRCRPDARSVVIEGDRLPSRCAGAGIGGGIEQPLRRCPAGLDLDQRVEQHRVFDRRLPAGHQAFVERSRRRRAVNGQRVVDRLDRAPRFHHRIVIGRPEQMQLYPRTHCDEPLDMRRDCSERQAFTSQPGS
jgi:hypothetical protein